METKILGNWQAIGIGILIGTISTASFLVITSSVVLDDVANRWVVGHFAQHKKGIG